jgi:hypothetical protein
MKRMLGVCTAAVLAVGSLTACGGGSSDSADNPSEAASSVITENGEGGTSDYCAAVQEAKRKFGGVSFSENDLTDAVSSIHEIADQAPASVSDEWATVDDALTQLVNDLTDLGLDPSDITNPSAIQSLAADPQKLRKLRSISKSFDTKTMTEAGNTIDEEVKADCGFSIGGSS